MTSPNTNPRIYVSWDGTGQMNGPFDDVTRDTAAEPGFSLDEGRDAAQTLSPPKLSAGAFELFNDTGKYSQHRADSPVYQRVLPGRPVLFGAKVGDRTPYRKSRPYRKSQVYPGVYTGTFGYHLIDEISQRTEWGSRRVAIRTVGREAVLTDSTVTIALQTNIRTDQAVVLLLDACGWPSTARSIAVSDTTLLYWWAEARHPWDALLELLGAEGPGTMYVDKAGVFHWENRNYRTITPRSTTSQATFSDHVEPGAYWFSSLGYDPGYASIYNRASYTTTRRAVGALQKVWELGATLSLSPGETRTLYARPNDPYLNAQTPAVGTDYNVSAGSASVSLVGTSGLVASIQVTAGGSGATIVGVTSSGMQLRAQPLTVVSETAVLNSVDASQSIATFSPIPGANIPITLDVAGWPEIDPVAAQAVCNAWVSRYMAPRPTWTFAIRNVDQPHAMQTLTRLVSDRITVHEANTGFSSDVWINGMQTHVLGGRAPVIELTLSCETCDTLSGVVWDGANAKWNDPQAVWGV